MSLDIFSLRCATICRLVFPTEGFSVRARPPSFHGTRRQERVEVRLEYKGQLTSVVFPCISSPKDILVTPAAKSYMHTLLTGESKLINIRM